MMQDNVNDRTRKFSIFFLSIAVLAMYCSTSEAQSLTLGRFMLSLETANREAEQRRIENRISDEQIGSTHSCFANMSQLGLAIMRSQAVLETQIVRLNENLNNGHASRGLSNSVKIILNDVEQNLMRKMSPTLESGASGNTVQYRMPEALTHNDVISIYSLNLLRNISAKIDDVSTATPNGKRRLEYESNFCETARRRAAAITPASRSPWIKAVEEMQAWSDFVSPALKGFEISTTFSGCQDAFTRGARDSGVYAISRDRMDTFRAWCDFDSSGGWMVFQRRFDGTVDFFRRWSEYQKGFGNLWGEYWLGLDKLHQLTQNAVALAIYMESFDAMAAWANYSSFRVGDVSVNYTLNINGYTGTAGDSLLYNNGSSFSTWDRDNDRDSGLHCARLFIGAWWYNDCSLSNLNGRYERGPTESIGTSNWWYDFKGFNYGLKVTVMRMLL